MKALILISSLLLSSSVFANSGAPACSSLFQEVATESVVFTISTSSRLKAIEPTIRGLELYDGGEKREIKIGDFVYIEFIEPIAKDNPTTTGSIEGYILGSRQLIDPSTGEAKTYYFVMDSEQLDSGLHAIVGFKLENVEPFQSEVRRDLSYRDRDQLH